MTISMTSDAMQTPGGAGWTDKKGIARRYGISVRKVDYLRSKGILPYYEVPSRCIRFHTRECDAAMERYRHGPRPGE